MTTTLRRAVFGAALASALMVPHRAAAQLDPLLYLKRTKPTVLIAVDTSERMQLDIDGTYIDDNVYKRNNTLSAWELALGVTDINTSSTYRRKFFGWARSNSGGDHFTADHIEIVGDRDSRYGTVDEGTRMSLARRAVYEAILRNSGIARFGLVRMRQNSPAFVTPSGGNATKWKINEGALAVLNNLAQQANTDDSGSRWQITTSTVAASNASVATAMANNVKADAAGANTSVLSTLATLTGAANSLLPAGQDDAGVVDAPVDNMLDDLRAEAARMIAADAECRNTVAVLVVGGGEGTTTSEDIVAKAATFLNVSGHRVPVHVIALGPLTAADRTKLQQVAAVSGGKYTEITSTMVQNKGTSLFVPELVAAVNFAISHTFVDQGDFDKAPDLSHPYGYGTTQQVTSPIVGTVNLEGAKDFYGNPLPDTLITHPVTGDPIPQRANVILTTGYSLPGFAGSLHAARVYRPVADASKSIGYKFVADGTKLWEASTPNDPNVRNIYTWVPVLGAIPFTKANAAALRQYLRASDVPAAERLIDLIRAQPLGAIVDSTPAVMDPPSLDPPPDSDYPAFANDNKNRRSIIWVGANDGMLHGIDARLGKEVWAFIPFNLLSKLWELKSGQPVGDFRYFVDGSPKVADVKVDGKWRTALVMGEGPGGSFYQTFDVTLPDMSAMVDPASDSLTDVLSYFSSTSSVPLVWSFPDYSHFDWGLSQWIIGQDGALQARSWGDVSGSATSVEKTVGETWSDPAVGQIESESSPYVVLTGSGFFRYRQQGEPQRGNIVAGSSFYMLDMASGKILDSVDVGNDNQNEKSNSCTLDSPNFCAQLKNALQADPVATGPDGSRFITKVYIGDLDGKIWRFDVGIGASGAPRIKATKNIYTISTAKSSKAAEHPVFASMATVNIGGSQQYLFVGTGSDLLPSTISAKIQYALLVIRDDGSSGTLTAQQLLEAVDGSGGEEKVSSFPAVAGDIVFFSTTTYKALACPKPDANLYAMTFIGGPAYDTNNDNKMNNLDSTRVRQTTGARATAPFIVDQHLVFGAGDSVEVFGDPQDFNNGVGQAGVRILSWREVR